jgi:hypothetical protein
LLNVLYWAGGVAQAVKHLLSKCEVLSSNPSTAKKLPDQPTNQTEKKINNNKKKKPKNQTTPKNYLLSLNCQPLPFYQPFPGSDLTYP